MFSAESHYDDSMKHITILFVCLTAACGSKTIDLTREPPVTSPNSGGGTGMPGAPCASISECETSTFCQRKSCGDVMGTCAVLPKECKATADIVCGCDGTSYANDCVRTAYGVSASTPGPCVVEEW